MVANDLRATVAPEAAKGNRRYGVLAICCMGLFIAGIDNTIVNVALPSIGRDLHTNLSGLQWTVDAYTLVLASLLMLSGSVADRLGRRRTLQVGLVIFTFGSLLCSLAPSVSLLVTFRIIQAIGGSMLNPVAMSIISSTFTVPRERAQAIGVWGGTAGVSMALGPVLGGLLVDSVGWQSIFWINVPIGIAACILAGLYVPESRAPRARRLDPLAQTLLVVLLFCMTFGIIEGPERGWGSPLILGMFAVSVAAGALFIGAEQRRAEPLIQLRFFRSTPFSSAILIAILSCAALAGFLFVTTLYLQQSHGLSAIHAGLDIAPMAAMMVVMGPLSGALVGRRGSRPSFVLAGALITVSAVMLTRLGAHTSYSWLFASFVVFGLGFGLVNTPITHAAVSGMPIAQSGVAAAVASTSRQIGQTLGVAVIGALATSRLHSSLATGLPDASHLGWWVIAGCGVTVFGLGILATSKRALASAQRAAATFDDEEPHVGAGRDRAWASSTANSTAGSTAPGDAAGRS